MRCASPMPPAVFVWSVPFLLMGRTGIQDKNGQGRKVERKKCEERLKQRKPQVAFMVQAL